MSQKMKSLVEQRDSLKKQLNEILVTAQTENRAMSDEENGRFEKSRLLIELSQPKIALAALTSQAMRQVQKSTVMSPPQLNSRSELLPTISMTAFPKIVLR